MAGTYDKQDANSVLNLFLLLFMFLFISVIRYKLSHSFYVYTNEQLKLPVIKSIKNVKLEKKTAAQGLAFLVSRLGMR